MSDIIKLESERLLQVCRDTMYPGMSDELYHFVQGVVYAVEKLTGADYYIDRKNCEIVKQEVNGEC